MGFIGKIFAIAMLPLSIIMVLESLGVFTLDFPFNKIIIASVLMITLQVLTLLFLKINHGRLGIMQYLTAGIFIVVALIATFSDFVSFLPEDKLHLALGMVMFVEALYALH
ncbi:hypothetical protein JW756_01150 [Candidatus Woesearchaeota archaeon]|nr:hypothetical protein [Candidatus Woesearchaeota archaeon]